MCAAGVEEGLRLTLHKNTTGLTPSASGYDVPPPCCVVLQLPREPKQPGVRFACAPDAAQHVPPAGEPLPEPPDDTFTFTGEPW